MTGVTFLLNSSIFPEALLKKLTGMNLQINLAPILPFWTSEMTNSDILWMSIKPLKTSNILMKMTPGVPVSNVYQILVRFYLRAAISSSNSVLWFYFYWGSSLIYSSFFYSTSFYSSPSCRPLLSLYFYFSMSFSFSLSFLSISLFSFSILYASQYLSITPLISTCWCVFSRASFRMLKQSFTLRFSLSPAQVIMKPVIPSRSSLVFLLWA